MNEYTIVAIPTLFESPLIGTLLDELVSTCCSDDVIDEVIVMNNRADRESLAAMYPGVREWSMPGVPFHRMWNHAWAHAKVWSTVTGRQPVNLVLLNDDVRIPHHFVLRLCEALRSRDDCWCAYPDYRLALASDGCCPAQLVPTKGTYKDGGLWGCAFALRGELMNNPLPPFDEQFEIWCGDDDLVKQIELAGKKVCRVEGLALEHVASTTFGQHPELGGKGWADVERFRAKYGAW